MGNLFNWVEIPTSDLERAKTFYHAILGKEGPKLQQESFGEIAVRELAHEAPTPALALAAGGRGGSTA